MTATPLGSFGLPWLFGTPAAAAAVARSAGLRAVCLHKGRGRLVFFLGRSVCDSGFLLVRREVSFFLVLLVRRDVSVSLVFMVCSARRIEFLDSCLAIRVVHVTGKVTAL